MTEQEIIEKKARKRATNQRYAQAHPERVEASRIKNKDHIREYQRAKVSTLEGRVKQVLKSSKVNAVTHGWVCCNGSPELLIAAFKAQDGKCAVCKTPEYECARRLACDHNHDTGDFRGWLCGRCNQMLGYAKDSIEILHAAVDYLEDAV